MDSSEYQDLTYGSMGLSAISAITGAFTQASAYRAQGDIESTISGINANISNLQAKEALETGDIEASRENLKTQQTGGAVRAQQGASGTDVGVGSNVLTRNAITEVGEQDELTIRNNAQRQAFGYQQQALQATYKAQFAQLTAKAQANQSLLTGGLQAVEGPLSIEANALRWQRYLGGSGDRLPFGEV